MSAPRKKYKPKQVVLNPTQYFLSGYKLIDPEVQTEANTKNHMALYMLIRGGRKEDFDTLVEMMNTSVVLCEKTFHLKYHTELLQARDRLQGLAARARETGVFKTVEGDVEPLYIALIINEEMLRVSRIIDFERAYDDVQVRLKKSVSVIKV